MLPLALAVKHKIKEARNNRYVYGVKPIHLQHVTHRFTRHNPYLYKSWNYALSLSIMMRAALSAAFLLPNRACTSA